MMKVCKHISEEDNEVRLVRMSISKVEYKDVS
jgi:hypothetical protein